MSYVHLVDQSFFAFDKGPTYVLVGYAILELAGIVTGVLLLVRPARSVWSAGALVAAGPMIGYVLSRGPGLPGYSDDRGNWSEQLGVASLVIEVLLLAFALAAMGPRSRP
ncbi:hypothetical protein ABIB25_000278 [Nakamurella sp. UYEF19]|uniref:hypothetical protein n=1 Tax=Nakamurella sp. UYEF19 TaxID=1756392 RepID=UPI0033920A17